MPDDLIDVLSIQVGDIIEDCEVLQKSNAHGLLMKINKKDFGLVHV